MDPIRVPPRHLGCGRPPGGVPRERIAPPPPFFCSAPPSLPKCCVPLPASQKNKLARAKPTAGARRFGRGGAAEDGLDMITPWCAAPGVLDVASGARTVPPQWKKPPLVLAAAARPTEGRCLAETAAGPVAKARKD